MKKFVAVVMSVVFIISVSAAVFAAAFEDVGDEFSWAKEAISSFYYEGIIQGRENGKFFPNEPVTRAEFAKMLCLSFDLKSEKQASYIDVDESSWMYEYINKSCLYTVDANVIDSSYKPVEYAPDINATREEIASGIANALQIAAADDEYIKKNFTDWDKVNKSIYAQVNAAAEKKIIQGYDDFTIRPKEYVTRAEAAVLLYRARKESQSPSLAPGSAAALSPTPNTTETAHPSIEPTASATPSAETNKKPQQIYDIVSVEDIVKTSVDGEIFYALYYAFGGVIFDEPIMVSEDADVVGVKTKISDISCGDLILYELHNKGYVRAIRVIYSPPSKMPEAEENLEKILGVSSQMNWGLYDSGKRTQVCLGRIYKAEAEENGIIIRIMYQDRVEQAVFVPYEDVRVSVYKPYIKSYKKRFEKIETREIIGGYDYDTNYIFAKVTKEEVTDIIIIEYELD